MLKSASHILIKPLVRLFNLILSSGHFPKQWCESHIVPLHKGGSKDDPINYRGISVMSCLSKLFTAILNTRLTDYLEKQTLIAPNQSGFRKNFGTRDNLFVVDSLTSKYINSNKRLYACFVDFRKAFDSVWRKGLRYKLLRSGIGGKFYELVKTMYSNSQTCVKTPEGLTPLFSTYKGVRQGCNLSPTLFSLFINDLVKELDNPDCVPPTLHSLFVSCLLYADDVVIFSETEKGLQSALDRLDMFCTNWKLQVNLKKTKVVIFNKAGRLFKDANFLFGSENIEITSSYCYLGLTLSSSGSFSLAKKQLSQKARKAVFSLKPLLRSSLSPKALLRIYNACIKSILLYGCEVWGKDYMNDNCPIEIIQNRFCKNVLGVHRSSSNSACRAELGIFPVDLDVSVRIVKYWLRLRQLNFSSHPLQVDALLSQQYLPENSRRKSWIHHVNEVLNNSGYSYIWQTDNIDNNFPCKLLRRRLNDIYIQTFFYKLSVDEGKLRFYKNVKTVYDMEKYLYHNNFEYRSAICKLRISSHLLEIEKGRYKNLPVHERICKQCAMNAVENETHFICECSRFDVERNSLFERVSEISPNFSLLNNHQKIIFLLTSSNLSNIENMGRFIFNCFQKRSQTPH